MRIISGMNMTEEISLRTQVLGNILDFQIENGHGIGFNDLVEISGKERAVVSKCHDSLSDMGMLEDVWHLEDENWNRVMEIPDGQLAFVINTIENIRKEMKEKEC